MIPREIVLKVTLENKCAAILTTHFVNPVYVSLKANGSCTEGDQRAPLDSRLSKRSDLKSQAPRNKKEAALTTPFSILSK